MNAFLSPESIKWLMLFIESLISGLKIIVPVLFLFSFIEKISKYEKYKSGVKTANQLMILGGILFLFTLISNLFVSWYYGNTDERDMILSYTTDHGWYRMILPVISYGILPIVLWHRRTRRTIYFSFAIVVFWYVSSFIIESTNPANSFQEKFDWQYFFIKTILFVAAFSILFLRNQAIKTNRTT
jgi:hypothetical protein